METNKQNPTDYPEQESSNTFKVLGGLALAALVVANGYLFWDMNRVRSEVKDLNAVMIEEVAAFRETSAIDNDKTRQEIAGLNAELTAAIDKAQTSVGRAKVEAKKHAEKLAGELAEKQTVQRQLIEERITGLQEDSTAKFDEVQTSVVEVKTEVTDNREQFRGEIDDMVAGMTQVRGDLGVMSGRIATNGDELAALKALGDRNYFEFDIARNADEPVRVGRIGIDLKGTDPGKNRFTMEVHADDKLISKKNRTVNEPIQFYVGGRGGLPYEIVVNEVDRGRIVGYLATPKVEMLARR